jgi:oligoendopeptidase F
MADAALGHYRPWIEDVRKEKPYQLEDRVEELFHEKSVTGRAHGTGCSTRRSARCASPSRQVARDRADAEPDAGRERAQTPRRLAGSCENFPRKLAHFALITNTLAKDKEIADRWRGFKDIADARHLATASSRRWWRHWSQAVRDAYPRLSHRYYA